MAKQRERTGKRGGLGRANEQWIREELDGCEFQDDHHRKRFAKLFRSYQVA